MLAVLVAVALAGAAATALFGLAWAAEVTASADVRYQRGLAAAQQVAVCLTDRLIWGRLPAVWRDAQEVTGQESTAGASSRWSVRRLAASGAGSRFQLVVTASAGAARADAGRVVAVRAARIPMGVTVAGDMHASAPVVLDGCGAYAGGDVRGRQFISFVSDGAGTAPDRARGDRWVTAGVHAGGRIHDEDGEVHAGGRADPSDTDACTGETGVLPLQWPLDAGMLAVLHAHAAVKLSGPLARGVLLPELAGAPSPSPAGLPQTGPVVLLDAGAGVVALHGWQDLSVPGRQLTVVVLGDAILTALPAPEPPGVALAGALLVTGTLTVSTPAVVAGGVAAGTLRVDAPLTVVVTGNWAQNPPPGAWIACSDYDSEEEP